MYISYCGEGIAAPLKHPDFTFNNYAAENLGPVDDVFITVTS